MFDEDRFSFGGRLPSDPGLSHGNRAFRWGDQATLTPSRSAATLVATPTFKIPTPFLLELDFADVTAPLLAVKVTVRRAVDELGSVVVEEFTGTGIPDGVSVPRIWLGHNLAVDVAVTDAFPGLQLTVKAACVPVCFADSSELLPNPPAYGPHGGYRTTVVTRIAAAAANTLLAVTRVDRRQLFIQNNSAQDLAVLFGAGVPSLAAGAENYSIILPGGSVGHYESPVGGYTGEVRGIWRAADATGEALITEGITP